MTPRGRLDERCFLEWIKGCVLLVFLTIALGGAWILSASLLLWMMAWWWPL
jgi:hypothetical protein